MTDQPYVFTNDNPLNAEDPLGLGGGGNCDLGTAKQIKKCQAGEQAANRAAAKAEAKSCPSGLYNSQYKCDPALAKQRCSYSTCASWLPMKIILVAGGIVGCIPGAAFCIATGLTETAVNVGSDVQNHCSHGNTFVDGILGILSSMAGGVFSIGGKGMDAWKGSEKSVYRATTGSGGFVQGFANAC